ncbi:MAG TPA: SMC-Scp complex subunit ScpB [bacterium]|nr:SMC-Scp complex subunit ScpB [bacterium]HEX67905.1 SMC-Scp complex subunit ScpB [bacterium]
MDRKPFLKGAVEALLFTSPLPLSLAKLKSLLSSSTEEIKGVIEELKREYSSEDRGIVLREVGGGYKIFVRKEYGEVVRKLGKKKKKKLSKAALETLALIAYRQPITRYEIEQLRGVDSRETIKTLKSLGLIKVVGKKDAPGKPLLYGTTREFLIRFGLKSLKELPKREEFLKWGKEKN